jgi:HSP20 family protein
MQMANLIRRDNGNARTFTSRDPFAFARDLLAWDPFSETGRSPGTFMPRFEVKERQDAYLFTADLPGVEEKDLDISLQNGVLTISGTRSAEQKNEGETFYVYERQYGEFARSFALPDNADGDKVEAKLVNGVLQLTVGKHEKAQPKKISLKKS